MTESEWLSSGDLLVMVDFLKSRTSMRKLRLFAASCFHRLSRFLHSDRQRNAVQTLERWADGLASEEEKRRASRDAHWAIEGDIRFNGYHVALMLFREFASSSTAHHAAQACLVGAAVDEPISLDQIERLHDIVGNPFRPVSLDPCHVSAEAVRLAKSAYEGRDFTILPILADALEEAGAAGEILSHLRSPGPHVRGCWALDLVLGLR